MGFRPFGAVIDLAQAADAVSQGLDFTGMNGASFQVVVSGTVATTITIEANNDPVGFPSNWQPVTIVAFTAVVAGSPASQIVEVSKMRSGWYRVRSASTSGTGLLRVVVHGKGD